MNAAARKSSLSSLIVPLVAIPICVSSMVDLRTYVRFGFNPIFLQILRRRSLYRKRRTPATILRAFVTSLTTLILVGGGTFEGTLDDEDEIDERPVFFIPLIVVRICGSDCKSASPSDRTRQSLWSNSVVTLVLHFILIDDSDGKPYL